MVAYLRMMSAALNFASSGFPDINFQTARTGLKKPVLDLSAYVVVRATHIRALLAADIFEIVNEAILVPPLFQGQVNFCSRPLKDAGVESQFVLPQTHYIVWIFPL
jgi:hypothetical protein